jgi:hypothetical protein
MTGVKHRLLEVGLEEPDLRFGDAPQVLTEVAIRLDGGSPIATQRVVDHGHHLQSLKVVAPDCVTGAGSWQSRNRVPPLDQLNRDRQLGRGLFQSL